jgi:hypothetical protein
MKNPPPKTLHIDSIDSATLAELREKFPTLDQEAAVRSGDSPASEDREVGTLVLVISLTAAGFQLAGAILTYLAAKEASKKR